jgi:4-hydroxybenzoate polyprenyltransferase/phosphoserine phosphatase
MAEIKTNQTKHNETLLCVDLDGTIVRTDTLWESILKILRTKPAILLYLPFWLLKGKAYLKHRIATYAQLRPNNIAYNEDVLFFLRSEHAKGREIILATASDFQIAESVAQYLGIFSGVLASDGIRNLSGKNKLEAIKNIVGSLGFEYLGNSTADLHIWKEAAKAHIVSPSRRLFHKVKEVAAVERVFASTEKKWTALIRSLRPHHWFKNLLLFVPLVTSHKINDPELLFRAFIAFVSLSLCASCSYIINDLLDLPVDLQHPRKRFRPFASGSLSIRTGLLLSLLLLVVGFTLSISILLVPFTLMLGLYFILTITYSLFLKEIPILDVLVLAGLYALRVLAGGVVVDVYITTWLLGFAIFIFLSLAFVKRYTELLLIQSEDKNALEGRGYIVRDIEIIRIVGPVSGYLSVLVLALYINSKEVLLLYKHPWVLWFLGPCFLYWITRIWLIAHRGQMHDDPIIFAIKDKVSYIVGIIAVVIIVAATI